MKVLYFLLFQLLSTIVLKINAALDHYEVVFTWAPSFRRLNPGECRSGLNEQFYLHGIWPIDENGGDPTQCQRTDPMTAINSLRRKLAATWPSIVATRHDQDFWLYEWQKHGRCGKLTPQEYFQLATQIDSTSYKKHLRNAGIAPDPTSRRSKTEFEDAIKAGRGLPNDHVYISCAPEPNTQPVRYLLYQIHICLDVYTKSASCSRPNNPGDCILPPL